MEMGAQTVIGGWDIGSTVARGIANQQSQATKLDSR